jgi:NAD(P)-dependent dehydrogenase (short-subunit alcohol dehydrogenase family)
MRRRRSSSAPTATGNDAVAEPQPQPQASRLRGRRALVTGAGRGIGRAIAERFLAEGAQVMLTQRTEEEGRRAEAELTRDYPGRVAFVAADIAQSHEAERIVNTTIERFGGLDIVCNNAGRGLLRAVHETTDYEYDSVMGINLKALFMVSRYAVGPMLAQGSGAIVNIGSVAGFVGFERDAAYCASKGAVLALTRQMALDYASRGIRVNCICPGFVETEMMRLFIDSHDEPASVESEIVSMHPIGRVGRPEEIAATAAFLASDEASFINGASLAVDGGLLAR